MRDAESGIVDRHVERVAREEVAPVVREHREALLREHRERPFGPHGDHLFRVLTFLRRLAADGRAEPEGRYVIVMTDPHREWTLGRLPRTRGEPPRLLEDERFDSQAAAEHAVFRKRLAAFEEQYCDDRDGSDAGGDR